MFAKVMICEKCLPLSNSPKQNYCFYLLNCFLLFYFSESLFNETRWGVFLSKSTKVSSSLRTCGKLSRHKNAFVALKQKWSESSTFTATRTLEVKLR